MFGEEQYKPSGDVKRFTEDAASLRDEELLERYRSFQEEANYDADLRIPPAEERHQGSRANLEIEDDYAILNALKAEIDERNKRKSAEGKALLVVPTLTEREQHENLDEAREGRIRKHNPTPEN